MDDDIQLGLYIIKVLCLIVIAMSVYKLSTSNDSYFTSAKADLPHLTERSDFTGNGSLETPVFWNMGSVQETNDLLQAAATMQETNESFQGKNVKSMKDFSSLENFAGTGM